MDTQLPEPPVEMAQMDWFLGDWRVVSRSISQNGDRVDEQLITSHTPILGGHVILEHFGGPLFGEPFEAWSLRKYNVKSQKWEQRWVDITPGGFADWTGSWDEPSEQFVGHPDRVLTDDGNVKPEAVQEVFFDIGQDSFRWKYERTSDGGQTWSAVWTLDYERFTV